MEMILACNVFNVIGDGNDLIWNIPEDLKYFKEQTLGRNIVMGKNTFTSLNRPNGLPGRTNFVISSGEVECGDGVRVIHSLDQVPSDSIIIGGATLYNHFMHSGKVDVIKVTQVGRIDGHDDSCGVHLSEDVYGACNSGDDCLFIGGEWGRTFIGSGEFNTTQCGKFYYRMVVLRRK